MEPPWELELELRRHIENCSCTCDHMGYGNYMDYQVAPAAHACLCRAITSPHAHAAVPEGMTFPGPLPDVAERCGRWAPDSLSASASGSSDEKPMPRRPRWRIALAALVVLAALGAALALPLALGGGGRATPEQRLTTIRRMLRDSPLVDGHNDLAWNVRKFLHNKISGFNLSAGLEGIEPWAKSRWSHTDIPRLRLGQVGAQFWSAYVPCGARDRDAVQLALEQMDVIKRVVEMNAAHLALVTDAAELLDAHRDGRIASLIGVEGGHALGDSLAVLRAFYQLGARYLTVTHTCDNRWAHAAGTSGGLTEFGRAVVREMNRLGMIVDLSHAGEETARDALETSQAPVVFSHSGAASLCNSSRNVPDDLLRLIAANGGVVMINFYAKLVTCGDRATVEDVVAHINHVRRVAGVEHVGLGAGYDGIDAPPEGLEDVSRYPHLLAELLRDPEWSEEDVRKLAGMNVVRVLQSVERVRDQWRRAAVLPGEETAGARRGECMYGTA
ncbi:dipeptidase 1-like [Hyposmocoma kahamanoa]|uniref:dipeptidase 1-like n=1 Tax=Hyposmocoma kahamanoa TaxID=1477025 RepID=UPI000E6D75D4|nr:dipeptidase 1-like [Hyposmocoma kahamanoa]